jgi:hypothetical protein
VTLHIGDCLDVMRTLPDASVDAVVTDPPYGLSFMGKRWDYDVPSVEVWAECLRVLKPGGHLLAFAGTRTHHRMAVNIEDAGFEIRDMIAWVYGSGFPKSLDVSKAIDRAAGVLKPEGQGFTVAGYSHAPDKLLHTAPSKGYTPPAPATPEAQQWAGWGTALKPSLEPVTVARKPLIGTVAENVLAHRTGALNINGCRVDAEQRPQIVSNRRLDHNSYGPGLGGSRSDGTTTQGRWPANLIHDGSDEVVRLFPQTTNGGANISETRKAGSATNILSGTGLSKPSNLAYAGDSGSAARFFYTAKASRDDRDHGNNHPTVKPTDLMRYLCRLVTPPSGTVLDPFMGSGSTGKAAMLEGFEFIGIEREPQYFAIAEQRITRAAAAGYQPSLLESA